MMDDVRKQEFIPTPPNLKVAIARIINAAANVAAPTFIPGHPQFRPASQGPDRLSVARTNALANASQKGTQILTEKELGLDLRAVTEW